MKKKVIKHFKKLYFSIVEKATTKIAHKQFLFDLTTNQSSNFEDDYVFVSFVNDVAFTFVNDDFFSFIDDILSSFLNDDFFTFINDILSLFIKNDFFRFNDDVSFANDHFFYE